MQSLGFLLNLKFQSRGGGDEDAEIPSASGGGSPSAASEAEPKKEDKIPEKEPVPEPVTMSEEVNEIKQRKVQALKEKEAGNAAYKKKNFETAIEHYSKAIELDDEDISYLTNRAAVYLEMGKGFFTLMEILRYRD